MAQNLLPVQIVIAVLVNAVQYATIYHADAVVSAIVAPAPV